MRTPPASGVWRACEATAMRRAATAGTGGPGLETDASAQAKGEKRAGLSRGSGKAAIGGGPREGRSGRVNFPWQWPGKERWR